MLLMVNTWSGTALGCTGLVRRRSPACSGVLDPFLELQEYQQVTMFFQTVLPPRARGTTWS